jgi:hypothetical protein
MDAQWEKNLLKSDTQVLVEILELVFPQDFNDFMELVHQQMEKKLKNLLLLE